MQIYLMVFLAGLFFGLWPLFMKYSGIKNVTVSTIAMEAVVLTVVILAGFRNMPVPGSATLSGNWSLLVLSGVSAAFGVLSFNKGLSLVGEQGTGGFIVLVMLVQLCVTAINQIWHDGGLTSSQALGFASAGLAVYLLTK